MVEDWGEDPKKKNVVITSVFRIEKGSTMMLNLNCLTRRVKVFNSMESSCISCQKNVLVTITMLEKMTVEKWKFIILKRRLDHSAKNKILFTFS